MGARALVILNPAANHNQAPSLWPRLRSALAGLDAEWVETQRPGDATRLAAEAARAGYNLAIAVGGDGTVHEIANGLMTVADHHTAVGVIPNGSGNDFAFSLGLPLDLEGACQRIMAGHARRIDLGYVRGGTSQGDRACYFVNGFGIGFDAAVAIESNKTKVVHGFLRYLTAALRTMLFYYNAPHMTATIDGHTISRPILMFSINNGRRIGGGFFLTPDAVPDDGWLDLCYAAPVSQPMMVRLIPEVMQGTHTRFACFTFGRARHITVQADRALPVYADGEIFADYADNLRHLELHLVPEALRVVS